MEKKDALMMQEKMALQRTTLANHRTLLSFLRTSMYFLVAGLSVKTVLRLEDDNVIHLSLYISAGLIFVLGIVVYIRQGKKLRRYRDRIADIRQEVRAILDED